MLHITYVLGKVNHHYLGLNTSN